jgi:hypothetical protein
MLILHYQKVQAIIYVFILPADVKHVAVAGGLWVFETSRELFLRVSEKFGSTINDTGRQYYDMDIGKCHSSVCSIPLLFNLIFKFKF